MRIVKAKSLGFLGEDLAAQYLKSKGYEILENNFTGGGGEIDLVARLQEILVFVEVKTRSNKNFGYGNESINKAKRLRMHRAIARYLSAFDDADYRVDIIEVELEPKAHA